MDWIERYRRPLDPPPPIPASPAAAADRLLAGNAAFIRETRPNDPTPTSVPPPGGVVTGGVVVPPPKQTPFAVVLGCSDARVPLEVSFGAGPNQLFIVRVAGNVLGAECLGSIEYACQNFKDQVRLVVVLGHTGCGAVAAAVGAYLNPKTHSAAFTRSVRAVVDHVLLAVRSAVLSLEQVWGADVTADPGYPAALAEAATYLNAAMTAYQLRSELEVDPGQVGIVFGVYDVVTARVIGPDTDPATEDVSKLAAPPAGPDELATLGRVLAGSPMVARHLSPGRRPAGG